MSTGSSFYFRPYLGLCHYNGKGIMFLGCFPSVC